MPGDRTETFGAFELRRLLGRGGMGEVWLAFDPMLEREVAVKLLAAGGALEESSEEILVREARAASALDHAGIVTVHQLGREHGKLFIAMEYVPGRSLGRILRDQGTLPPDRVADFVEQVASALGAAHEAGLIHRDVKPENVVVRDDGRAKVLDFGLAHAARRRGPSPAIRVGSGSPGLAEGSPPAVTEPLAFDQTAHASPPPGADETQIVVGEGGGSEATVGAGTPLYMAPEQVDGRTPTAATDQFGLAATAFELLLGRPLRRGDSVPEVLSSPIEETLRQSEGELSRETIDVLARALATDPKDRFASITEFSSALRKALAPEASGEKPGRPRRLWLAAAVALLALALAGGAAFFARSGTGQPEELVMAVIPGNRALFIQVYTPVAAALAEARGAPVRPVIAPDYEDVVDGLVQRRYQLAFLPPTTYVEARSRLPGLALLGGRGYTHGIRYRSLIVGRPGVGSRLEDLRGETICFVDPDSTSGNRVPRAMLHEHGLEEGSGFQAVYSGDHYNALRQLVDGRCAASAVSSLQFADAPRQGLSTDELVILARSDPLPPIAFVATEQVSPATRATLREALPLAFRRAREHMGTLPSESAEVVDVDDSAYDVVRNLPK